MAPTEASWASPTSPFYELAVYDGEQPLGRVFVAYKPSDEEAVLVLSEVERQLQEAYDGIVARWAATMGAAAVATAETKEAAQALRNVRRLLDRAKAQVP